MKSINCFAKLNKAILALSICLISSNLMSDKAYSQASISSSAMFMNAGTTTTTNNIVTNITTGVTTNLSQTIANTGVITTVSAESVLPSGLFFSGNLLVTPAYSTFNGASVVSSLSIGTTGSPSIQTVPENASFNRAAAQTLTNAAAGSITNPNLELIIGIIRAGAGVNGLD